MDAVESFVRKYEQRRGWKVVQVVALVRAEDADDLEDGCSKFVEFSDLAVSALVTTRELTLHEQYDFSELIEDAAENEDEA